MDYNITKSIDMGQKKQLYRFSLPMTWLDFKLEFIAGLTTFLTMSYILALNPLILGGAGMDKGAVFVATCLAGALGSFLMGFLADYPIALAPSMSLNVYFTYVVVQKLGYPWELALGAVFISGILFLLLTLAGVRQWLIHILPFSLKIGVMSGIGFFLGLVGLKNIHLVSIDPYPWPLFHNFLQTDALLALLGFSLIILFERLRFLGAIFLSILIVTLISLCFHLTTYQGIIATPPSIAPVFLKLQLPSFTDTKLLFTILIFLFVALFNNAGTLIAVLSQAKLIPPNGKIENLKQALIADSLANIGGALLGTSTTGNYIESATGVRAGGRTGLTSLFVSLFFLIALAFSPLINTIPPCATAPTLIYVAFLISKNSGQLLNKNWIEHLPGLIVTFAIPCFFSIAIGIALGFISHAAISIALGKIKTLPWGMWILTFLSILYLVCTIAN